jgi:hypothetical protein
MNPQCEPLILHGDVCTLVPLSHSHHDDLVDAAKDDEF